MRNRIIMLMAVMLLAGCQKKETPKSPPPKVTTTAVKQEDVPIYLEAIGQVVSTDIVYIRPQVAGKLMKAYVEQGSFVKEGDVLFEIDPRPYQASLDEANAQLKHDQALLEYAEKVVERYKKVVDEDFISVLNFEQYVSNADAARAQVELDQASVAAAQLNLDFCKIVAPTTGKMSYSNVYVGNILAVDDANQITTVLPISPIDIFFSLPQQQFEMIRHEQGNEGKWDFVATLPEYPKNEFHGTTYFIDNQIDQDTGTILLKGRLPNEKQEMWPGEFIRIKVLYKMAKGALIVPPSAVLIGKDGPYVYTVDRNGKAAVAIVTILTKTDAYTAVESKTLHAGDAVVSEGQINIAPGLAVNAMSAAKPASQHQ